MEDFLAADPEFRKKQLVVLKELTWQEYNRVSALLRDTEIELGKQNVSLQLAKGIKRASDGGKARGGLENRSVPEKIHKVASLSVTTPETALSAADGRVI